MKFYDMHVHPEVELIKVLAFAEKLGWNGLCLIYNDIKELEEARMALKSVKHIDISFGVKLEPKRANDIPVMVERVRKRAEMVLVYGGDLEINRKACETAGVDILCHPELGREDSGLDHIMAKLAKKNFVAIEFNFRQLLMLYSQNRSKYFSNMEINAKLVQKYNVPFVLTSGAVSCWDLRAPSELSSLGKLLGFDGKEVKNALSGWILENNRKRLSGKWVMPGVELE